METDSRKERNKRNTCACTEPRVPEGARDPHAGGFQHRKWAWACTTDTPSGGDGGRGLGGFQRPLQGDWGSRPLVMRGLPCSADLSKEVISDPLLRTRPLVQSLPCTGLAKSPFIFFHKIKDAFFIFSNILIVLDILSMLALFPQLASSGQRLGLLLNIFQWIRQPHSKGLFGQNVNSTKKLYEPLLIHLISNSTFSIHCTNLVLWFSSIFTFLEIIRHNAPKMLCISFHLQYWNGCTKIHQFW